LHPLQIELEASFVAPELPVIFVIGAPRSGTTLVSQLLAYSGSIGYVSNFVARFWLAPLIGAKLEAGLGLRDEEPVEPFVSEYGVTKGCTSPHEFGYFWSYWFDQGQETHTLTNEEVHQIDSTRLRRRVASLEAFWEQPLSFKNNTWCTFQAGYLADVFPSAIFLVCRKDPVYIAQSLLLARRERLGRDDAWWSMRPTSYPALLKLPWWKQVAAQALEVEREMLKALKPVASSRKIEIHYAELCARPKKLMQELRDHLNSTNIKLEPFRDVPSEFRSTDTQRVSNRDWQLINDAVAEFRRSGGPISG
ncbi:MAG: sulfotransferase, partial [Pyrinomonadaceae bacterium]